MISGVFNFILFDRLDVWRGLGIVAVLNALAPPVAGAFVQHGALGAVGVLFGIDAIVLAGCGVAFGLLGWRKGGAVNLADGMVAVLVAAIILVPHKTAGWIALGVIGLHLMVTHRRLAPVAAAGAVCVALSVHEVWGKMALSALTPWLSTADAVLATALLRAGGEDVLREGNLIVTGKGYDLVVVAACTSFKAVLHGLLAAVVFTRAVRPAWHRSEVLTWLVLTALIVTLNTGRLAVYGISLSHYETFHDGNGGLLFGWMVLSVALIVAAWGVRHEFGIRHAHS